MKKKTEGEDSSRQPRSKRRIGLTILVVLFLLFGAGFVLYPLVSNTVYETNQSYVRTDYEDALAATAQEELEEALELARVYNENLLTGSITMTDPFDPDLILDPEEKPYADLLDMDGSGLMGYIEIPCIDVELPIYHGTTSEVLEKGVGHLQNSSLPVGGESTHTVLTGHTGLSGKKLFTDLTQVEEGDVFYLYIYGETLAYQVESIEIVEPDEVDSLRIVEGEDLATLVTCYPYGINSHRLLVHGTRIDYEEAVEVQEERGDSATGSLWVQEYRKAVLLCVAIYLPVTVILIYIIRHKRNKKEEKSEGGEKHEDSGRHEGGEMHENREKYESDGKHETSDQRSST